MVENGKDFFLLVVTKIFIINPVPNQNFPHGI